MSDFSTSDWRDLEEVVEKLQRKFHQGAIIKRNDFIEGVKTKTRRQLDITIRYHLGTSPILLVVDCKRRKSKVDSPQMQSFIGTMDDVRANHGIIVSERGFTKGAKNLAELRGVQIYTLRDTREKGWPSDLRFQFFVEVYTLEVFALHVLKEDGTPWPFEPDDTLRLIDVATNTETTLDDFVSAAWTKNGKRTDELCFEFPSQWEIDGPRTKLQIGIRPSVVRYSRVATVEFVGLRDEASETTYTDSYEMVARGDAQPQFHDEPEFWKKSKAMFGIKIQTVAVKYRKADEPMRPPELLNALMPYLPMSMEVSFGKPRKFDLDRPAKPPLTGSIRPAASAT
jgi:hypothetical protein